MIRNHRSERLRVQSDCSGPSLTQQHERDETDINLIVKRYVRGDQSVVNSREATYGDVSGAVDLAEAFNRVEEAREQFASLPSSIRKIAENSPVKLLELLSTVDGVQDLVDAGLVVEGYEPASQEPEIVAPPVEGDSPPAE